MERVSASKVARWPRTMTRWALVYLCCFVLVGMISFGVCYAYFSAKTEAIGTIATGILKVEYNDADSNTTSNLSTQVTRTDSYGDVEIVEDSIIMPGDNINILGSVTNTGTIDGYVILQAEFILMSEADTTVEEKVQDVKFYNLDGTELVYDTTSKIYTTSATLLAQDASVDLVNDSEESKIVYTVYTGLTNKYAERTFKLKLTIHAYQGENLIHDTEKYSSLGIQATNEMLTNISRLVTNFKVVGNSVSTTADLPTEYQQVEYIESTGTQYIDTGVIPSNTVGFKIKMELPEVASDTFRFGCRQDAGNTRFVLGTSNGVVYFGFNTTISGTWTIKANTSFEGSLNYLNSRVANVNNANDQQLSDISTNFTYPLIMFGRNSAGTISSSAQKIYSCKITDGSEIVRDFIPCYRIADNVIGMYDKVNDVFYTNGGTGEFLKGNDINGSVNAPVKFNWVGEKTKNLLKFTDNVYGTLVVSDGSVWSDYKCATTTDYFPLKAGTYMISYNFGINLRHIVIFNGNKELLNNFWSNRANPYKFTLDSDCLVRIDFERANNANIENLDTFYEEFEVLLTDDLSSRIYEPSNKYKVTINGRAEGKNLMPTSVLDKNAYVYNYGLSHPTVYTFPALQAGKTYTLSLDYTKGQETYFYLYKRTEGKSSWVKNTLGTEFQFWPITNNSSTRKYSITFTAEENTTYFFYGNSTSYLESALNSISNVQLEEGDTATEYVPHNSANHTFFLDEPLRKVGDVADEIVWENGQFVVKRRTGEIVFTGDESWGLYNGGTYNGVSEGKSFYILNSEWKREYQTSICSHYKNINSSWAGAYNDRLGIYSDHSGNAYKYFRAPDSSITTLDGFKAWLKEQYNAGTAVTLVYQLAEEKEEILNIDQMFTLAGETNYTFDTTVPPSDYYIS